MQFEVWRCECLLVILHISSVLSPPSHHVLTTHNPTEKGRDRLRSPSIRARVSVVAWSLSMRESHLYSRGNRNWVLTEHRILQIEYSLLYAIGVLYFVRSKSNVSGPVTYRIRDDSWPSSSPRPQTPLVADPSLSLWDSPQAVFYSYRTAPNGLPFVSPLPYSVLCMDTHTHPHPFAAIRAFSH